MDKAKGVWAPWITPLRRALQLAAEYQSEGHVKSVGMKRMADGSVVISVAIEWDEQKPEHRYRYDPQKKRLEEMN